MDWILVAIVVLLIGVAIAVQLYYLQGLRKAGVGVSPAVKFVSYANMGLLAAVALGLVAYFLIVRG